MGRPSLRVAVFDLDGTLLDSADGIVAGFRHALAEVGVEAPSDAELRSDLGPPVWDVFTAAGVPADRLEEAVLVFRRFNLAYGIQQSSVYPGVREMLEELGGRGVRLGVATAKRTETAHAVLALHGLGSCFGAVVGTSDDRRTKVETLGRALVELGPVDPDHAVMVGDRHSDLAAARSWGVRAVGVSWGYGSVDELRAASADLIVDRPSEIPRIV